MLTWTRLFLRAERRSRRHVCRVSSCYDICVLILLWDTHVSSYYICVLILLCPHSMAYVSSYYYMCVLMLLHTCPQACSYARSTAGRASPVVRRADAHKRLSWDALTLTKIKKKNAGRASAVMGRADAEGCGFNIATQAV
jgi:hypothetical protein